MHVQADLLHDISDVGLCERQVLEGFGNAPDLIGVHNLGMQYRFITQ
jgi:hypothetical protein